MPDGSFEVEVETAPGAWDEPTPLRFRLGQRVVEAAEILDRWPGQDHLYAKLRGSDGAVHLLRHDRELGRWQLVLYRRGGGEPIRS